MLFRVGAAPSKRATGRTLEQRETRKFKCGNQELHFKDFGKSRKRENNVGNKLSEMSSFP